MANNFMRNANKVSLDGEVVSFSNTFPILKSVSNERYGKRRGLK